MPRKIRVIFKVGISYSQSKIYRILLKDFTNFSTFLLTRIFILALFSQHECLIYVTKRLKIRLIEEFKEWSKKFRWEGIKFKYDDLHSVHLVWSMYDGGIYITLRHDLSRTVKGYRRDYTDVPVPILRASIRYFKERWSKELPAKRKIS